ncbi:MAG: alpha/beta hydrolase [Cyclobacteriaceae bacterium]
MNLTSATCSRINKAGLYFMLSSIFWSALASLALGQELSPGTYYTFPERIALADGRYVTGERGLLSVPINRAKQDNSASIIIEFFRFKGTNEEARRHSPIFRLYGGPGFSGLDNRLSDPEFYAREIEPFLSVADFVVVGQRGIGTSLPNTLCGSIDYSSSELTEDAVRQAIQDACRECKAFWEGQSLDLSSFNIIEAAADVDDVRQALGYDQIMLWGGSFGSHWSMAVMRYHPEVIERALLWGLEGPNHTYDVPSYVLNSVKRVAAAADTAAALQDYIPEGGLIAALETVIERVEQESVTITFNPESEDGQVVINADVVRDVALGYSGQISSRRNMPTWPSDILHLYAEDYEPLARAVYYYRQNSQLPTASFFMLDCASGITPERHQQIADDPAQKILGNTGGFYDAACPVWDTDLGDDFRANFDTNIPTLLANGTWDTSTPIENVRELKPYFKNSHLLVIEGGSHSAFNEAMAESEALQMEVKEFLSSGDFTGLPETVTLPPIDWKVPNLPTAKADE